MYCNEHCSTPVGDVRDQERIVLLPELVRERGFLESNPLRSEIDSSKKEHVRGPLLGSRLEAVSRNVLRVLIVCFRIQYVTVCSPREKASICCGPAEKKVEYPFGVEGLMHVKSKSSHWCSVEVLRTGASSGLMSIVLRRAYHQ
ncbi:hypothetical protein TNCV_1418901 [Trichonephila clavipes]|nr:hypothetical protein TNCV_1418901 [Trichonephila clavipes]